MEAIITAIIGAIVTIYVARVDAKTKAIHKEVTVNSHSSEKPTIKDSLDDIKKGVEEVRQGLLEHLSWHDRQER